MKKIILSLALAFGLTAVPQETQAQSFLNNILGSLAGSSSSSSSSEGQNSGSSSSSNALGDILNSVTSSATGSNSSEVGNILGNVISAVAGDVTTTASSILGTWTYTAPAVQFESDNLLTKAGGAAVAQKVETKLAKYYKVVGIKEGTLKFTFNNDGTCTYGVGSRSLSGTYTFDSETKTITIKTTTGLSVKTYVTVSGSTMSLCFDASKLLTLFTALSSKFSSLSTITSIASNYDGMKVGFKFSK